MSASEQEYQRYKDLGNDKFKAKEFVAARDYYTKAIQAKGTEPVAFSNRAACNINLGQYYIVIEDCNKAIELDPNMSKAYYRRAVALRHLSRLNLALEDFRKTLNMEPGNKLVEIEIKKLEEIFKKNTRIDVECYEKPERFCSKKPMQTFPLDGRYEGTVQYQL